MEKFRAFGNLKCCRINIVFSANNQSRLTLNYVSCCVNIGEGRISKLSLWWLIQTRELEWGQSFLVPDRSTESCQREDINLVFKFHEKWSSRCNLFDTSDRKIGPNSVGKQELWFFVYFSKIDEYDEKNIFQIARNFFSFIRRNFVSSDL